MPNVNWGSLIPSEAAQQRQNELIEHIGQQPDNHTLEVACKAFFEMIEDDDPTAIWEETPHRGVIVKSFSYFSLTKAMKAALSAAFEEVRK